MENLLDWEIGGWDINLVKIVSYLIKWRLFCASQSAIVFQMMLWSRLGHRGVILW